jgi:hypothetical protein
MRDRSLRTSPRIVNGCLRQDKYLLIEFSLPAFFEQIRRRQTTKSGRIERFLRLCVRYLQNKAQNEAEGKEVGFHVFWFEVQF